MPGDKLNAPAVASATAATGTDAARVGPGPGELELQPLLTSGTPDLAAIASVLARYPQERAALAALVQHALGNQTMLQVLASQPTGGATAPTPAGPGLTALARLIVGHEGSAPPLDDVIALLDLHPGEHEELVDAIGTYLGDAYVTQLAARMPHLRVHWKQLYLAAGDPTSATGNFLEAGKDLEGGRFRYTGPHGRATYTGEFGGKVGYDVQASWQNGNFIHASQQLDGAEWKLGKFTGAAKGGNVDAQYAFTDAKALRLHFEGKTSTATLGFYRGGQLRGPELAATYKSGTDYSVGLQRSFGLGGGTTGTVGARHWVDKNVGVGDPGTKTTADQTREALTFDINGPQGNLRTFAGVHPGGQFTAGVLGQTKLGPSTNLQGQVALDGKDVRGSLGLQHTWQPGLTTNVEAYADPTKQTVGLGTRYAQHPDGTGLTMEMALRYLKNPATVPMWSADFVQRYVGKTIIQELSLHGGTGATQSFTGNASVDLQLAPKVFASAWGSWQLHSDAAPTGTGAMAIAFTPASDKLVKAAFIIDGNTAYEAMVEFDVLKTSVSSVKGYSEAHKKAALGVFMSYGNHGNTSMFDAQYGKPTLGPQFGAGTGTLTIGVRLGL